MRRLIHYDPHNDYYEVIGVSPDASPEDIQRAYRRRAKEVHPDTNPDRRAWATEAFKQLSEAYRVLSSAPLRAEYDALRQPHKSVAPASSSPPPMSWNPPWPDPPPPDYWDQEMARSARRRQLRLLWRWRWFLFWTVVGVVLMMMGLCNLTARPPPPPPPPSIDGMTVGEACIPDAWNLSRLALEVAEGSRRPHALLVDGTADADFFVLELYDGEEALLFQTNPMQGAAEQGQLARLDIGLMRDATYTLRLTALDDHHEACEVTFWIR